MGFLALAEAFYDFKKESSVEFSSSRKVVRVFDNTLHELNASQTTVAKQPSLCLKASKIDNRYYYLEFDGVDDSIISDVDLNKKPGVEDIFTFNVVYYRKPRKGIHRHQGIPGTDNGGGGTTYG